MSLEEVLACGIDQWYSEFRHVTFETQLLPLPAKVRAFLLSDGILLPPPASRGGAGGCDEDSDGSEWGDAGPDGSSDSDEDTKPVSFDFPDFEAAVLEAIESLGRAVLPKLNWSAPKDAKWLFNTLRCQTPHEIFTLLKASDFVAHDLCHCFDDCSDRSSAADAMSSGFEGATLALRRWRDIDESAEFRCFVAADHIHGVTQRHASVYFPHLADGQLLTTIRNSICSFFDDHIRGRFRLQRYAFDVVVGSLPKCKVKLLDFSPWSPSTDPLLFDWDELHELTTGEPPCHADSGAELAGPASTPEVRVVRSDYGRKARLENYHCVPLELVELGSASPDEVERLCSRAEAARKAHQRS